MKQKKASMNSTIFSIGFVDEILTSSSHISFVFNKKNQSCPYVDQ